MKYFFLIVFCLLIGSSKCQFVSTARIHDVADLNFGQININLSAESQSYQDAVKRLIDRG